MLKLYDYSRSSACFRVRIALNLKKLPYDLIPIHLVNNGGEQFSDTYQALNPHQLVPSLEHDALILNESMAIIEYLDEIQPMPALLPTQAKERAKVRAFALSIVANIHPLNNLRVLTYLKKELNVTEEAKQQWYHNWIQKGLSALEHQLARDNKNAAFSFGETPSLADICLVPQLFNARRFNCDLNPYPTLLRVDAHCQQHPAFATAWPREV